MLLLEQGPKKKRISSVSRFALSCLAPNTAAYCPLVAIVLPNDIEGNMASTGSGNARDPKNSQVISAPSRTTMTDAVGVVKLYAAFAAALPCDSTESKSEVGVSWADLM